MEEPSGKLTDVWTRMPSVVRPPAPPAGVIAVAGILFTGLFATRLFLIESVAAGLLVLNVIPIGLLALEFGPRGGLIGAIIGMAAFHGWVVLGDVDMIAMGYLSYAVAYVLVGVGLGAVMARRSVAEEALRASEHRHRLLTEGASDMISVHAPDGTYLYVSPMCRTLLGYEPEELVGTDAYAYFHPDDVPAVNESHEEVLARPDLTTVTYRVRRKDGLYVWFETNARSDRDERGSPILIHASSRDVTKLEHERILVKAERRQKQGRVDRAIDEGEVSFVFQPICTLVEGESIGFEALARFDGEPRRGPMEWFSEAHETDRGEELELCAVRLALSHLPLLPDNLFLAVNVHPSTILHDDFSAAVEKFSDRIVIEITEHAPVDDYLEFGLRMGRLRESGVRLAIDDVGSGYASLAHILDLDPDMIKLDRSIIAGLHDDASRRAMVAGVVAVASTTGATLVAEGIEETGQLDTLRDLGVSCGQGYLLGRPGPLPAHAEMDDDAVGCDGDASPLWLA